MELTQELLRSNAAELSQKTLVSTQTISRTTTLDITFIAADAIVLSYMTLPGNVPNTYGNYVALWQGVNVLPPNAEPLALMSIPTNAQNGSVVLPGPHLADNNYIVGYAVGPVLSEASNQPYGNICSTAFIPAVGRGGASDRFQPGLLIQYVSPTSIAVRYSLPVGITPANNGAWIGLWNLETASYRIKPVAGAPITENSGQGSAFINNIQLQRGKVYTIALLTSGWKGSVEQSEQTTLACSVTFSV